ncbi:MAG: ribonuclease III [Methylophilaceae bacterium]|nr:ribonuclease III [Methylophilaceae bacterium]
MSVESLARRLGYHFSHPELLQRALVHRSHGATNYERLEFLGDSVLNCVISSLLYHGFPNLPEGELSRLRSHLVKESTLCELASGLNLGEYLKLGEGERRSGGSTRASVLADALEAIIGATYLDGGFAAAQALVSRLYESRLKGLDPKSLGKDPKTRLQEYLQGRKLALPQYTVLAVEGEAHCQTFRVECAIPALGIRTEGVGASRRAAEQQAARAAYEAADHD